MNSINISNFGAKVLQNALMNQKYIAKNCY